MPASQKKAPGIFISYRRSDNPDAVGRIYDRLVSEFGRAKVFKDVDSIPLGRDFRSYLDDIVGGCAVVLTVIGPKWLDVRNEAGGRRLEDPGDFVRIELEAALARNVPILPVLVGHVAMPGAGQLPASLSELVYRQSVEVRPDPDFHNDSTRLVTALRQILDPHAPAVEPMTGMHAASATTPRASATTGRPLKWMVALTIAILTAAALAIPALKHLREQPPPEMRSEINTPPTDQSADFALSPDGRQIVFVGRDTTASRLWLRSLSSSVAQPLPGTEGASAPFWSADSRSIAFFVPGAMKRLDLAGGQPQLLTATANFGVGADWNPDGVILFSGLGQSIMKIAATGGAKSQPVVGIGKNNLGLYPTFLPDGRRFLFSSPDPTMSGIYLGSLDDAKPVRLVSDSARANFFPGWMLWLRSGSLLAQRLDIDKRTLVGEPVTIADGVSSMSVARNGLIAYRGTAADQRHLAWVDRSGRVLGKVGDPDESLLSPRISPDGRRIVVSRSAQDNTDLWIVEGARTSRMTFEPETQGIPVWSPDGSRIAFTSAQAEGSMYQKLASGAGTQEQLVAPSATDGGLYPTSWSADGRYLMYFNVSLGKALGADIWVLPMTGDRKPFRFIHTQALEVWGQFSPDGRWVAYQSNESGRNEVYIRPFAPPGSPAVTGQWQVSVSGGVHPLWRRDGKELYFLDPAGMMMAASIASTGSAVAPGVPQTLFQSNSVGGGIDQAQGRQYDVAADGRFLINIGASSTAQPITLLQNWNPDARK